MVPVFLLVVLFYDKLRNWYWSHHRVDRNEKEEPFTNFLFIPCGFVDGDCRDFGTCRMAARNNDFPGDFQQVSLPGWGDECQCINRYRNELSVCKFGAGDSSGFIHQRE